MSFRSAFQTTVTGLVLCGITSLQVVTAQDNAAAASPNTATANLPQANPQGPNAMAATAFQRGMLSCAARVQQVTQFVGFGPQAGGMLMAPPAPVDRNLFSMQIEASAGAQGNSFIDTSFAPNQGNGCGATYTAVSYWSQTCDVVGNQQFAQLKRLQPIQRDVAVLDGGPATKVFLMRAGDSGCISIKKEIVL